MKKICHLTSVHSRYDVRIFHKECKSLQKQGYNVTLIVADDKGNEVKDKINIIDVGKPDNRIKRILKTTGKIYKKAQQIDADIYHFHDPELIPLGLKLLKKGKKVIYDVHEDLPRQLLSKPYLNKFFKNILSKIIEKYENFAVKKFTYIVTATPFITERFIKLNRQTIDIKNYPIIGEITEIIPFSQKKNQICYVGGLSKHRGIYELIESLKYSKIELNLAGNFEDNEFKQKCQQSEGWRYVNYYGFVSREEIKEILNVSKIGIVTLYPIINYLDALPIKMFEYMLAGLPVIASNFPLWKKIIEENKCGITVNPLDSKRIAELVLYLLKNEKQMIEMGQNGRKSVLNKFNWELEAEKLLEIYKKI